MIRTQGTWFKDESGRRLLLRGVNLGGSSKVPYSPNGATWNRAGFFDHRSVSFVGRPFPLDEADEHFRRLQHWGFTFIRFVVTWEAIEHAGPGLYDEAYLDYVCEVIRRANDYGITVFIDPHQDVWSRFSGGDGAPGWTFEVAGLDLTQFDATGAAITHQVHGDPFPRMIWPTNYGKFACATMFTLFFGGNSFAPQTRVNGEPVQEFLQGHYIAAICRLAERLKDLPNVAGYGTLNEPSAGYIGLADIRTGRPGTLLLKGPSPTALQGMLLASGYPQRVEVWDAGVTGIRRWGRVWLNPQRRQAWAPGCDPIWEQHGVWDVDPSGEPRPLQPEYFARVNGQKVNFARDFLRPFANRFARAIRQVQPEALIFVESEPGRHDLAWTADDEPGIVHAGHWYDGLTLFTKSFTPWLAINMATGGLALGRRRSRQAFYAGIAQLKHVSEVQMNGVPTLIGETGIPFDMRNKRAYRTGDFSLQIQALDATMQALETNLVSFTLWNYTADNTNRRGDQWNDEDLSLFSRDQMTGRGDLYDGGRALQAALRPYATKTAGEPRRMAFDIRTRVFEFEFQADPAVSAPTEIFVPAYHYPAGIRVTAPDGRVDYDPQTQCLSYHANPGIALHRLKIEPAPK